MGSNLFWDWMEAQAERSSRRTDRPVQRDDPATWTVWNGWPEDNEYQGLLGKRGVGQSAWMWWARGLPVVRAAFAAIWGTDRLHVSFTGGTAMRPVGDGGCVTRRRGRFLFLLPNYSSWTLPREAPGRRPRPWDLVLGSGVLGFGVLGSGAGIWFWDLVP